MPKARRLRVRLPMVGAVVAIAGALLLIGCGDTVIDDTKAEDAVQADLEETFHDKISAVECPSDQKVEAGKTFTCTVEYASGERAIATLKILNDDADVEFVGLKTKK